MRTMMIVVAMLFAACSDGPSDNDAGQVYVAAYNLTAAARIRAVYYTTGPAIDYVDNCKLGGTARVIGSYTQPPNDPDHPTYDLTFTFDHCAATPVNDIRQELDGQLIMSSRVIGTDVSTGMSGSIVYTDDSATWSCTLDVKETFDTTFHFSGTVCGQTINGALSAPEDD